MLKVFLLLRYDLVKIWKIIEKQDFHRQWENPHFSNKKKLNVQISISLSFNEKEQVYYIVLCITKKNW